MITIMTYAHKYKNTRTTGSVSCTSEADGQLYGAKGVQQLYYVVKRLKPS